MANLPGSGGIGVGAARGDITIGHNFDQVIAASRNFSIQLERAFGNVDRSTRRVENNVKRVNAAMQQLKQGAAAFAGTALAGPAGGVVGALAIGQPAIAAGVALGEAARAARTQAAVSVQAASDLTESINKVGVAFDQSGRQILAWSKNSATALGQSRQQALEAASSFGLLFRTMGIAPEESARMSEALVQLAADMASINNISPEEALTKLRAGLVGEIEPLRAVGVLLDAVSTEAKAMELGLASSTSALTQQDKVLARYQLILEQTALTQGDFSRTSRDAANLQRILAAQVADFNTELGKTILPGYVVLLQGATSAMSRLNAIVETGTGAVEKYARAWREVISFIQLLSGGVSFRTAIDLAVDRPIPAGTSRTGQRLAAGLPAQREAATPRFDDDQTAAIREWSQARADIEDTANQARLDATEQYESQRTSAIRGYERTIAREAEDFARQRARAETQFQQDFAEVQEDGAKREAEITRNLGRREADIHEQLGKRQADIREQVNDRLLDIEENYQKARERATRDHRDNLMDAASRLDARAIFEEQRRFKRQQEDLLEARDEQVEQAQEGANEQLEQAQEAADDQIQVARESAAEQLEVARQNTQDRLTEMLADFEDRKREEDIDRGIRLTRMAEDHDDQLSEMARQHSQRIKQIGEHAQQERDKLDEEFLRTLDELDVFIDGFEERQKRITNIAIKNYDKLFDHITRSLRAPPPPSTGGGRFGLPEIPEFQHGGFVPRDMLALLHRGERVLSANQVQSGAASIQIEAGAFQFHGLSGDPADLQLAVEGAFANILEQIKGPM